MLARIALVATLFASLSMVPVEAAPALAAVPLGELSTPELLNRAVARGRLDRPTADRYLALAFSDHRRLPDRFVSDVPWDGTLPLLKLRERLARMPPGQSRAAIRQALDPAMCFGEPDGPDEDSTSPYFHVHYDSTTLDPSLTIGAYVESLDTTWETEVVDFGWAAPPLAPSFTKYPVLINELMPGLYGFVASTFGVGNNPSTPWNEGDAQASCMVLNEDYTGFPSPPQASLNATTAHEFNHSIQFGYGALTGPNRPDAAFIEGGATWMEDEVFDGANDNHNFLWPDFTQSMGEYTPSPYRYWVIFRALTERFGAGVAGGGEDVMEAFWEAVSQSGSAIDLAALNEALVAKGTTLADAYHAAAVALKFNVACAGGIVYPHCLEEGPAYVAAETPTPLNATIASVNGAVTRTLQDDYALNWIAIPSAGGSYSVTLQNNSAVGGQFRASVVCLTASGMAVTPLPAVVGPSSSTALASFDPSSCTGTPVAVITNQSQTAADPPSSSARSYTLSTASAASTFPLTVSISGGGQVTSDVEGVDCPGDCAE